MNHVFRCRNKSLPPGEHKTTLVSIETVPSPLNRERDATEFRFQNTDGEITKLAGTVMRIGEGLHEFAEQLLGTPIVCDDEVDLDECIGRAYEVTVVPNRTGGVTIDSVKPISE